MDCSTKNQSVLYPMGEHVALYLNIFRGEPAISKFVWHIAPNLKSSQNIALFTGAVLPSYLYEVQPAQG